MIFSVAIFLIILSLCLKSKDLALIFSAIMMPMITTFGMIFVISVLFFFLYMKEIIIYIKEKSIYRDVFIAYTILITLSALIAQDKHYFWALQTIFAFIIIPLCLCICLNSKNNIFRFVNMAYKCTVVCVIYSLIEVLTYSNPIVKMAISQNAFSGELMTGVRFGVKQIQCLFSYHETAGCFFWMMAVFFTWLLLMENKILSRKKMIVIIIFSSMCCFFTGSRSSIISLCVGMVPFALVNKKYIILVPIAFIVCAYFMPEYFSNIFTSIIDSDNSSVGGSNANMRETQLETSIYYMYNSPNGVIWGNGLGFSDNNLIGKVSELAGAESLWFRLMIDQGILGIIIMIYFFVYSIIVTYKVNKFLPTLVLAFLCAKTIAVVPCVEVSWLFVFVGFFVIQNRMVLYDKK